MHEQKKLILAMWRQIVIFMITQKTAEMQKYSIYIGISIRIIQNVYLYP